MGNENSVPVFWSHFANKSGKKGNTAEKNTGESRALMSLTEQALQAIPPPLLEVQRYFQSSLNKYGLLQSRTQGQQRESTVLQYFNNPPPTIASKIKGTSSLAGSNGCQDLEDSNFVLLRLENGTSPMVV